MLRYVLFFLLAYLGWKIFRTVMRLAGRRAQDFHRPYGTVHEPPEQPRTQPKPFTDVKDAKFEEVPPEKKKS